jgi:hypothetical protein
VQHLDTRNPRGPSDGITVSAPIPGEVQCSAPAGSVFIQDTRTCELARDRLYLAKPSSSRFRPHRSYRHPVCSFYHFLEHHAPLNPSCLGGHTTHTAVSGYCTGHSSACWSVRPRTAMVSRLAPWWLSIQEFGKIPAGYLTLEQYEDCPEELQPLVRHLCEDVPDQLQ